MPSLPKGLSYSAAAGRTRPSPGLHQPREPAGGCWAVSEGATPSATLTHSAPAPARTTLTSGRVRSLPRIYLTVMTSVSYDVAQTFENWCFALFGTYHTFPA